MKHEFTARRLAHQGPVPALARSAAANSTPTLAMCLSQGVNHG